MLPENLHADVEAIRRIDAVPSILEVVCRTTHMGFAAVARVTDERWIACSVRDEIDFGLKPGGELALETTLCNEIRQSGEPIVIDHVAEDPSFCGHDTPARYGFQSYISMPIRTPNGDFFGTLCAIDPKPARLNTSETITMFRLFADLIGFHLDAQQRLASVQADLTSERSHSELREEFIAVLGHDLRNPLASITSGTRLLRRWVVQPDAKGVLELIDASARRMGALIDNVLDFARGRLGGGLSLRRDADEPLAAVIEQVLAELQATHPEQSIDLAIDLREPVSCDRLRIGQLLSNLVANALTHGDRSAPVKVHARSADGVFELSVANQGKPIPSAVLDKLFQPFFRTHMQPTQQGLGLGLYIASEIARSHQGELRVSSTADETRFILQMPAVEHRDAQ